MTPRPIALTEIVDGLRKRVASAHEAIAQCSKDRESCPPDDRCDDCEAEQQLIVLLDAAIARLEQSEQAFKRFRAGIESLRTLDHDGQACVLLFDVECEVEGLRVALTATPSPEEP